jgi:hypothetical protein
MKQVTLSKQKWFLTAALFTVLAGNYAFQTSSKNSGTFEMALTAAESAKTQAATTAPGACKDCSESAAPSVLLKLEDYNKLTARIAELEKKSSEAAKPADDKKEEAVKPETRAEKRERLAQEKRDKLKEKEDERVAKFEDKMQDIQDKCEKDLQCLATEFTTALSKFDGKNSIPKGVVNKYFKSIVSLPLARSLYTDGPNSQAALEALQSLMSDVPEQYRGIKEITMDAVRYQASIPANRVSQGYKTLSDLSKQNNPQAYFEQLNRTRDDEQTVANQSTAYSALIEQTLRETGDQSSFSYYQRSYLPNMTKIMNSMTVPSTVEQTQQQQQLDNSARNSRNGQAVQAQQQNQQQLNTNQTRRGGNIQQPVQQSMQSQMPWNMSNQNNGVSSGQPTMQTRGGRGRY